MANETVLVGQGRDTALLTRTAADVKWATLMGKWHEDRYGREVQQFIGRWVPDNDYQLSDEVRAVPAAEHAMDAADAAAKARGQSIGLQFSAEEEYTARRGEASTTEDDLMHMAGEKLGDLASRAANWMGLESMARVISTHTKSDRIANRRILARNLLSRWRDEGAAGALLQGNALRRNRYDGSIRTDSETNFTTAGFQDPAHNFNVDGWDRRIWDGY